ncbi:hypothetical protein Poli38472_002037 [Pythium oligandrum]|uniref:Uncharacterized protein n=1 Tax=Pythium oligandrum TaxID=41045 RepID=A0A8K1CGH8_PYTOL|nr:hypothetical protein Poli38472_002037 [Pythium oligandrum]|eukprot:TMW63096.1 hypothetical protein Poli38472_002037 [Pythium oligandrum]
MSSSTREWRWRVWHDEDCAWLSALEARNKRLVARVSSAASEPNRPSERAIPQIIHQIWLGPHKIPPRCVNWMNSWTQLHPDWEYRVWRDADVTRLSLKNQSAFDAATNFGAKSDILRYEILEMVGGVYVDVDTQCVRPVDTLVKHFAFVVGISNTGCVEINNGFIAATPHHPILTHLIDSIQQDFKRPRLNTATLSLIAQMCGPGIGLPGQLLPPDSQSNPMETIERTGPGLLTRVFMQAIGWSTTERGFLSDDEQEDVVALPETYLYPLPNTLSTISSDELSVQLPSTAFTVHYWERSWLPSPS